MVQIPTWMTDPGKWDPQTRRVRAAWHETLGNVPYAGKGPYKVPICELDAWLLLRGDKIMVPSKPSENRGARLHLNRDKVGQHQMNRRFDAYCYVRKNLDQQDKRNDEDRTPNPRPNAKTGARRPYPAVSGLVPGRPAQQANAQPTPNGIGQALVGQDQATQDGGLAQPPTVTGPPAYGVAHYPNPHQYPNVMGAGIMPQLSAQQMTADVFPEETAHLRMLDPHAYGVAQYPYPHQHPTHMGTGFMPQWPAQQVNDSTLPLGMAQTQWMPGMHMADQYPAFTGAGEMPQLPSQEVHHLPPSLGTGEQLTGLETAPEPCWETDFMNEDFSTSLPNDAAGSDGTLVAPQASPDLAVADAETAEAVALLANENGYWDESTLRAVQEWNESFPHQ
ncbi:hypothetical protein LTR78_006403 [Recurvomyces mirabilis]|uniref:Uncharacterized protein n=1 Tax=Recurvomyces mirabilis TaxID=574656 RepID=A0AAE0WLB3_9PEZI|nr:hypothetical protein LTR78_006403 [Recurvomyces mirabilis]KAK5152290.1 hypothetical protein LTS14_008667 [Recurvomyces mirabilis]